MSYYNSSYKKVFLGTQVSGAEAGQNANPNLTNGFITVAGKSTAVLANTSAVAANNYGLGSYGFFDPKTSLSVTAESLADSCCPLILAGAAIFDKDKIGNFHGGYQESNKSKIINPKLIKRFVRIDPCTAQAQVTHIGNTKYTKSLSPVNSACTFEFVCGETYTLRIDVEGAPALRFLNHQAYRFIDFNTGCCPADNPTEVVDSTLVMIGWAQKIVDDPILSNFIDPIVYDEAGNVWYKPGSTLGNTWDNYSSPGHVDGQTAGLRLQGAYVDTTFENCTFYPTDYFGLEPVVIKVGMMDFTGDVCAFSGICIINECNGLQVNGTGEQAVRDLILSESYRQNDTNTGMDLRIREITMGNQIIGALSRSTLYTRYIIEHVVPRQYNPSSTFNHDVYSLHIISNGVNTAFQNFMSSWLSSCGDGCKSLEIESCTPCTILTP